MLFANSLQLFISSRKWGKIFLALAIFFITLPGNAQVLRSCDLTAHLDSLIASIPTGSGTNEYVPPDSLQRITWKGIIRDLTAGENGPAHLAALSLGYQVVLVTDTGRSFASSYPVLERCSNDTAPYWGTFVFNPNASRPHLVIQCPHPAYDSNTGEQGVRVFLQSQPYALFFSGAMRCNASQFSDCSGTTTACSDTSAPFRISDPAHTTAGTFQATTEVLLAADSNLIVFQLHGMATYPGDPRVIISNGTYTSPSGMDYALRFRDALLAEDSSMTFKLPHIDIGWTKLAGTTNTQGRLINGSTDPCSRAATSATGRFVHVEQQRSGLRDVEASWERVGRAVAAAVDPLSAVDEPPTKDARLQTAPSLVLTVQNNPFNSSTLICFSLPRTQSIRLDIVNVAGRTVATLANEVLPSGSHQVVWVPQAQSSGTYFARLLYPGGSAVKRLVFVK